MLNMTSSTSTAFAPRVGMGVIDLDFLTIDDGSVQFLDGHVSAIVVRHCHEGISLLGDVDIGDLSTPNYM